MDGQNKLTPDVPSSGLAIGGALYLDLLKKCLTRTIALEPYAQLGGGRTPFKRLVYSGLRRLLGRLGLEIVRRAPESIAGKRTRGEDWPAGAETMIGIERLNNLEMCVLNVIREAVPGDLLEAGVWRGGACIFMRAVLKAAGDTRRTVWVADSFQGIPKPDPTRYPADAGDDLWTRAPLRVSCADVQENFEKYGLLDEQVKFLEGWFRDTLPRAPIEALAVLRLDGDLYESTMDALENLYPKLSVGGYAIIDDYALPPCKAAVDDYRQRHGIRNELQPIDWTGVYWRRRPDDFEP